MINKDHDLIPHLVKITKPLVKGLGLDDTVLTTLANGVVEQILEYCNQTIFPEQAMFVAVDMLVDKCNAHVRIGGSDVASFSDGSQSWGFNNKDYNQRLNKYRRLVW